MGERVRKSETTSYLVQVGRDDDWKDAGMITVPAGTRRKTVFEKALVEVDLGVTEGQEAAVRCIPVEHAISQTVAYDAPAPQLRIVS